jgi:hypothetical protein
MEAVLLDAVVVLSVAPARALAAEPPSSTAIRRFPEAVIGPSPLGSRPIRVRREIL